MSLFDGMGDFPLESWNQRRWSSTNDHYEQVCAFILKQGAVKSDRTGTGTQAIFGPQIRYRLLEDGFPLITTKQVYTRPMIEELMWMLSGSTNNNDLKAKNVKIWNEWADSEGQLGPIYGQQWRGWGAGDGTRSYPGIDQIEATLKLLREDPDSRRILVSAWNVTDLPLMKLSPCHALFQFFTRDLTFRERLITTEQPGWGDPFKKTGANGFAEGEWDKENEGDVGKYLDNLGVPKRGLSCKLYQRSADMFLGVPFNIASYALLTHMVAQQVGMVPLEFIWSGGDCHIYSNHVNQMTEQVSRKPYPFPKLELRKAKDLYSYTPQDVQFLEYQHHPALHGDVAV